MQLPVTLSLTGFTQIFPFKITVLFFIVTPEALPGNKTILLALGAFWGFR